MKDVHGAAERLAGKRLAQEGIRQAHHRIGLGQIVFGIGFVGECRHSVADRQPFGTLADSIHEAPGLVAEGAWLGGILHPFGAGPRRQVRSAHAATFQA
jgi:hypothetical protein